MRSAFDAPINVGPLSSLGMDDIDDAISLAHNEEDSHQGFNLRCAAHQRPDTTFLLEKRAALPSSYPSSIASSWSKPPRSVWFQQKAIIVTSIFLAIFIVLFIGAAVFLRDRNLDVDEYDESDEAQVERMRNERRQAGMRLDGGGGGGNDDGEKDVDQRRSRKKRKNARRSSKESERGVVANGSRDNSEKDPSTGSSSALNRGRHLVSRWTRMSSRKPLLVRDTTGMSDSGSIRSTRSGRRLALGHPTSSSDEVVHSSNEETSRDISGSQESSRSQRSLRPPATPPPSGPHLTETVSSQGRSDGSEASSSRGRVVLDDSDFRAAEEAEEARRALNVMPPAYIPSNTRGRSSGGISGASPDGLTTIQDADLDAAVAHGDLKRGIPPPTDRDEDVSRELIRTALLDSGGYLGEGGSGQAGDTSLHAGHIATDEKATLNAITAAATSPDGLARHHRSAPAYADGEPSNPAAGVSAHEAGSPSAPVLSDEEDFELHGGPVGGQDHAEATTGSSRLTLPLPGIPSTDASEWPKEKGKGKSSTSGSRSSFLPEPPKPVDPTFSPFDQPYQPVWPPRISSSFSSSGQIRSSSRPDPTAPVASRHDSSLEVTSAAQDREPSRSSEKQRMAELELGLVSSSPADLLDTSSGHGGMVEDLPAYQKDSSHSHVSQPTAPDDSDDTAEEGALSPSMESNPSGVPSAPPNLDALEEEEIEYADGVPP
ncbi:hypothetical protein IE53DRAFT_360934 [Violaceomyces palustris]|uniref:Uncharacterized protein n=1 Tax=Violaceomyces palustris TaxID=1673888 RepID=A0ACD0P2D0_9BASI|nr:hypothetical protein IE53DRAFT_360934 [Violaceomyces palustris]